MLYTFLHPKATPDHLVVPVVKCEACGQEVRAELRGDESRIDLPPDRAGQPPSTGQYTEGDVITFLGYLSADLPELHNVEMQRFHDAWDEYLRRIGRAAETKNSEHPIDCMQCEIHGKGE